MAQNEENALYLKVGAGVGIPPTGQKVLFLDTDGTLKLMDSTGAKSAIGGGGSLNTEYYTALVANGQTIDVTGLNGDLTGAFMLEFLINVNANGSIGFFPNGLGTNLLATPSDVLAGAVQRTDWQFAANLANPTTFQAGDKIYGCGFFFAKSGRIRHIHIQAWTDQTANDSMRIDGAWTDTVTNLVNFAIIASAGTTLGVGSYLRLLNLNLVN